MATKNTRLFASLGLLYSLLQQPVPVASSSIVNTTNGYVQGAVSEYESGVNVFKGIRYGASTAGANRWKPPQPVSNWTGVYNATVAGEQCPQRGYAAVGDGPLEGSEDCLFLNIWTPENFTSTSNYPVYFWIYGGRFEGGSGSDLTYEGSGLVKRGVVVVTINYRLGALGYLAHSELLAEDANNSTGNYGLLDQQAALRWVKDNIAHFGGNSSQITVGGQSAGAGSTLAIVYSPLTKGLFQGAIAESGARAPHDPETGSLASSHRNMSRALAQGVDYIKSLNVSTIAEARNLTADTIIGSGLQADNIFNGTVFADNVAYLEPPLFRPVVDGYALPYTYEEVLSGNLHNDVPILTGNNKDESGASPTPGFTLTSYEENNTAIFEPIGLADRYFALFPANTTDEANNQTNNFYRNQSTVSTWLWANAWAAGGAQSEVYTYYWTHAPPGQDQGAFHGSEINYAMHNLPYATTLFGGTLNWTQRDYDIADKMSAYWINFIKTGNPNGANLTYWASSTQDSKNTMLLGDGWGTMAVAEDEIIELIEEYFNQEISY